MARGESKDKSNKQQKSKRCSISISPDRYMELDRNIMSFGYFRGWSDFCYSAYRDFLLDYAVQQNGILDDIAKANLSPNEAFNTFTRENRAMFTQLSKAADEYFGTSRTEQIQITLWPAIIEKTEAFDDSDQYIQAILRVAIFTYARKMTERIAMSNQYNKRYNAMLDAYTGVDGKGNKDYLSMWFKES